MKQLTILILGLFIGFQSIAQDTAKILELTPVLVTSVRADKKTPVTQKTIGDTSIQESYQGQEIPILLSSLPSMYSNSDGGHAQGYSYVSLRGASQSRINMTLNGVPLNEPEDHGVYTSNFPSFINAIQSIQIQRGVGTSSNGAASFIGSVNFQSKNGFYKGNEIQFGVGSFSTFRVNASISTGLKKNFASFLNVGGISTDGFRRNSGSTGGSLFYTGGYYGSKQITKLVFFTGVSANRMAWEGSDEEILKSDFRNNPRGNDNEDLFKQTHLQLHNTILFNKQNRLKTILFYNHLNGHYDIYNRQELPILGYYASEKQYSNWIGYVGQYEYNSQFFDVTLGTSLNTYTRYHDGIEYYTNTDKFQYSNSGRKDEVSGFIKINYGNNEFRTFLDIQGRYIKFDYSGDKLFNRSWSFLNPKLGIKEFITPNFDIYASMSMSHREPTRSTLFNNSFYLVDLNDVKPEKVVDIEIGSNYKSKRLKLQLNIYAMDFENEIVPAGPLGTNSLPKMINVQNSVRYGFEFDGDYSILKNLSYSACGSLSYNGFSRMGGYHIFSPSLIINHSLTYNWKQISLNLNQSIYSKAYIDVENKYSVPACSTLGFNVSYTYKNCKVLLQGNNITNNRYYFNGYVIGTKRYLFPNALNNYYVTFNIKL